ncbi:Xaa-Pro peptidase family protein [Fictibacillus enclensis]|uniref:M24 family metallopeptidase n=1 Tax=Fictibacillus enclensis TaxID=1017270 RepID=UPI0025A084D0|nr:Xaa-Pro peptidase family protein [Fictibacillus enclensis]MDM5196728.1 Xaa-Pro peptidase family protein [Fictibacillus enclensis]
MDTSVFKERINRVRKTMAGKELDICILTNRASIRYFTSLRMNTAAFSILLISQDDIKYVVARLDVQRAERDCWIKDIISFPEDTPDYLQVLNDFFNQWNRLRIGLELPELNYEMYHYLHEKWPKAEFTNIADEMGRLRTIKSDAEIAIIRRSAHIADKAMQQALEAAKPGMKEYEVTAVARYVMLKEGAENPSFEPFLASGENSWLPQRYASDKVLQPFELNLLDMGGIYQGYCSDITRTFSVGETTPKQKRLFTDVLRVQQETIQSLRPGIRAGEVDFTARRAIEELGYGEYFPHLTGHGLGIDIHEGPIIDKGRTDILQKNMVLTIEPGVYLPGVGAVRIEDMVLITEDGYELLTCTKRNLIS